MAMEVIRSDSNGETNFGDTLIGTLRKAYGAHFAKGCRDDDKLRDVLDKLDAPSLSALIYSQRHDRLEEICQPTT